MKKEFFLPKKIVIIGGGFAGMELANKLKKGENEVTVIDKNNYHEFSPLFYQIASCGLEPSAICFPLRREFRRSKHIHYILGEVTKIDTHAKIVITEIGETPYDELIIACGTTSNFYGLDQVQTYGFTLKSTAEALLLRNQILLCLERAICCPDVASRRKMLSFVICGGGATGVEVAGALGEMKRFIIPKQYPELNSSEVSIQLIETSDRLLSGMSDVAAQKALQFLEELQVEILLNTKILDYDSQTVFTSVNKKIPTDTLIWTAGVKTNYIEGFQKEDFGPAGRFIVDQTNKLPQYNDVYAIGDCCIMMNEQYPRGHAQVAQVALQQAQNLAKNLLEGTNSPFSYWDKGSMATIGRNRAVVDIKNSHLHGRFAWMLWLVVHLATLVGVRNKIITFINWIWNYFSYNSSLRLLIRPVKRGKRPKPTCESSHEKSTEDPAS